jgi:isochorismate hydrolase
MRSIEVPEYKVHDEVQVDPSDTALIVVDMQNDFVKEGGSLLVPDAEATIPKIKGLLERARRSGMKVVFTQDTHTDGDPEWEIWPEHVREGSWGWKVVEELRPLEDELVIRKVRYDAFYGTHLDHFCGSGGRSPSSSAARLPTSASTTLQRAPPYAGSRW